MLAFFFLSRPSLRPCAISAASIPSVHPMKTFFTLWRNLTKKSHLQQHETHDTRHDTHDMSDEELGVK